MTKKSVKKPKETQKDSINPIGLMKMGEMTGKIFDLRPKETPKQTGSLGFLITVLFMLNTLGMGALAIVTNLHIESIKKNQVTVPVVASEPVYYKTILWELRRLELRIKSASRVDVASDLSYKKEKEFFYDRIVNFSLENQLKWLQMVRESYDNRIIKAGYYILVEPIGTSYVEYVFPSYTKITLEDIREPESRNTETTQLKIDDGRVGSVTFADLVPWDK